MSNARAWVVSLRLRTLPLALASTGMGSFLAAGFRMQGDIVTSPPYNGLRLFNLKTCLLTFLTAILLQILSNLANDYGDYKTGADNKERIGPQRALQSGAISISAMRNSIIFVSLITLLSGSILLYDATGGFQNGAFIIFFIIGLLSIVAAIKYTMGKNPYGYSGFGDIAVFIFFGIVGVWGTFYLHASLFSFDVLLPACTLGFLGAGVLNVNNMRDIKSDSESGKNTIVVRMGLPNAKRYHLVLIIFAFISLIWFTCLNWYSVWHWTFILTLPLFILHLSGVMRSDSKSMDKYLKQLALSTLLLVLTYGICIVLYPFAFYYF